MALYKDTSMLTDHAMQSSVASSGLRMPKYEVDSGAKVPQKRF